jgi:hypothetical protein
MARKLLAYSWAIMILKNVDKVKVISSFLFKLVTSWPADTQLKRTTRTNCCTYTLLPPDDGQLVIPKHVEE